MFRALLGTEKRPIQLLHDRTAEDALLLPLVSHFIIHIYMASAFLLQVKEHGILETLLLDHSFPHSPQLGFKFADRRLPFSCAKIAMIKSTHFEFSM